MKEYFFAELRRRLSVMGIPSADPVGGWLPILWGGEPVVFVSRSGDVFFEKNHVGQKDIEDLYDTTANLAAEVKEYTTAVENSPQLKADRLDAAFRLLAEFNGTVFAGRKWQNDQGYADLAYNDPSLIPQAVEKNGLTLALTGVTWHGEGGTGANGSLIPTSYTATASYSGTGSTRYATGYLTTADYAGTVTKTVTEKILYEVEYRGTPIPEPEPEPQEENSSLPLWIPIGAGAVLLGGGTAGAVLAVRKRRNLTR